MRCDGRARNVVGGVLKEESSVAFKLVAAFELRWLGFFESGAGAHKTRTVLTVNRPLRERDTVRCKSKSGRF